MTHPTKRKSSEEPRGSTNGLAITALVFGIISFVLLPLIGPIVAIITGHIARSQVHRRQQESSGMALAG